jgi:hypothetical protein
MHVSFSNVPHLQLVKLQFMTSNVLACLDTQETGEIFATEFHLIKFSQYWLAARGMMIAQTLPHVETEHVLIPVLKTNRVHQMQIVELPDMNLFVLVQTGT